MHGQQGNAHQVTQAIGSMREGNVHVSGEISSVSMLHKNLERRKYNTTPHPCSCRNSSHGFFTATDAEGSFLRCLHLARNGWCGDIGHLPAAFHLFSSE